ncbi:prephenate dehydratase [Emcibacter nanhaiensis]|uniref:prephenate dehydratase n=1 Tax=Emcibacter nanhaiensis TaxID=1505037 RepID=A0A501PBT7_9PROT|nr:prephenate dehydratase [Emcibacter nanhaiensis]TPD57820.1 prephenate dehydratase [Emcibacter nanhaiensis]
MATTEQTSQSNSTLIAFQGEPGAYSHLACRTFFPDREALPCATFDAAFDAVENGQAEFAMIPIENSVAGRVADIHQLMPHKKLHIVGEHFQRVNHHLLVLPGTKMEDLDLVRSHEQALGQCRGHIAEWGLKAEAYTDTAGAAKLLSQIKDPGMAAIASSLAGEIYGLESLREGIEDAEHNTTRFVILSRDEKIAPSDIPCVTTFLFQTRNVPAALYKALGGFATNGINMTKLESYQLEGSFNASQFYADIEGHPDDPSVKLAMEELDFFTNDIRLLGTYPQADYRIEQRKKAGQ